MDPASKKRKPDDNGISAAAISHRLTPEDAKKILDSFSRDDLISIVASAMATDPSSSVLASVRAVADSDATKRKLFIRGLGWETTSESLRSIFSSFGELDEAIVINDKITGKSKGYGFIVFKHVDGALLALKEPSKKIDGRVTVTQLASAGNTAGPDGAGTVDIAKRKIYVGAVPPDMPSERLLALFSSYGEIQEGPLGIDKQTGLFRGYALFVYKHEEAAHAAIAEPFKLLDGHQITCKLAIDGKKGKPGFPPEHNNVEPMPAPYGGQYGGGPGAGISSYGGGFSNTGGYPGNQPSVGAGGGIGGYGSGLGGPYGSSSQYPGPGAGGFGGMGMGSSQYNNRMPPASSGVGGGGGYGEGGPYSMSSMGHLGQHHPQPPSPPGPRVPPGGGMYQGMPHYY